MLTGGGVTQVNNVIDRKPYLCYRWELYRLTTNGDRLTLELLNEKPFLTYVDLYI